MKVKIDDIREIDNNPRLLNEGKLDQIKKSLREFPEMMNLRPIVINRKNQILGGNLRWRAAKELGWTEVECVCLDNDQKEYEFLVKDNLSYGDWNWSSLVEDYKSDILIDWGVDIPVWFKDLEVSMEAKPAFYPEKTTETDGEAKSFATKKALYLFFSTQEKQEVVGLMEGIREGRSNEQIFMDLIKSYV